MLNDGKDSRKDDKKKTTSRRRMKWLLDKLIEIPLVVTLEVMLQHLWAQMLGGAEPIEIAKAIVFYNI